MRNLLLLPAFAAFAAAIWPIPSSLSTGNSTFFIDSDCDINYTGAIQVGAIRLQQEPFEWVSLRLC
jgi:hypothetical protein